MLTNYDSYLRTKCQVVSIGGTFVYPIFRVGYTSLMEDADMVFTNNEITLCDTIEILLRDPKERFISGVNEYCRQNGKGLNHIYRKIQVGKLVDRHFMPQYLWLLHLYKYHKGPIVLRPFSYIKEITQIHARANERHRRIEPIERFTKVDNLLLRHLNKTVSLRDIITRYRDVLS
jgi:hypothetical protein